VGLTIEWAIIDCHDLARMSEFWRAALDFELELIGPSGGHLLVARDGSGSRLGLIPTPDAKATKNRVHLDLRPDDQDAEVERLEGLGATRVDVGQQEVSWVVMADPEGNEFCVLRSRR
jgi:predicted enzyme related to lactoylglutathione lyase